MSKVTAPLLSFGGSGQIGKSLVFGTWRGIPTVRRFVIPANPRTAGQQLTRDTFRMLNAAWLNAPASVVAPWSAAATGQAFTDRNKFVGDNVRLLRSQPDLANMVVSSGARGGLNPSSVLFTPASDSIDVTVTAPTPPSGWSLTSVEAAAIPDQAPDATFSGPWVAASEPDTVTPVSLTGLDASTDYLVAGWLVWTKPNGQTAYSVSTTDIVTTLA